MPALTLLASNGLDWRSGWPIGWPPRLPAATEARPAPVLERPLPDEPVLADADWIARVRRGDEDAARALVERLYPTVIKSVRRHLPPRTSAEDLTQAVFAKVFKNLQQFSGFVPLEHWVSRIAVNTCLNQLKHEKIRPELRWADLSEAEAAVLDSLGGTSADLPPDDNCASREVVEKLLAELNPQDRLVIHL